MDIIEVVDRFVMFKPFSNTRAMSFHTSSSPVLVEDQELRSIYFSELERAESGVYNVECHKYQRTHQADELHSVPYQTTEWAVAVTPLDVPQWLSDVHDKYAGMNEGTVYKYGSDASPALIAVGINLLVGGTGSGKSTLIMEIAEQIKDREDNIKAFLVNEPGGATSLPVVLQQIFLTPEKYIFIDSISAMNIMLPEGPTQKAGLNPWIPLMLQILNTAALMTGKVVIATYNVENIMSLRNVLAAQVMTCVEVQGGLVVWKDSKRLIQNKIWGVRDTRTPLSDEQLTDIPMLEISISPQPVKRPDLPLIREGAAMVPVIDEHALKAEQSVALQVMFRNSSDPISAASNYHLTEIL